MKRAEIKPPPHLKFRDRWSWTRLFRQRDNAVTWAMEIGGGLKELQGYLDRIGELEGARGQTGSRDALELWNMAICRVREQRPAWVHTRTPQDPFPFLAVSMFSGCDDLLPSSPFPRLQRSTVAQLGNERLLAAREAEDAAIEQHLWRAVKRFPRSYDGTRDGLEEWTDRYCLGDPELALQALQLIDSEDGRQALQTLSAPWQSAPEKTDRTINPLWWNYEAPRQHEYRKQVAQMSEDTRPFSDELEEYVSWRERLLQEFNEIIRAQQDPG